MPLVLTTNDVVRNPEHAWNDIEGVQYHYPNQYKNKIHAGVEFVYYRGVHRKDGSRGPAEYFGRGRIGAVRPDPSTEGESRPSWFCAIEDYEPFNPPVPAKINDVTIEKIPGNMWRNGVRDLDDATFERIVAEAEHSTKPASQDADFDNADEADNLIAPASKVSGNNGPRGGGYRRSKRAKEVGDWAEAKALAFIRGNLPCSELVHRAANAETPGWDIDYVDLHGVLHRVEVKGTVGGAFAGIDLTAGELHAAKLHGDNYWLYLVSGCLGNHPRIQRINNPASRIAADDWQLAPTLFRVSFGGRD